MLHAGGGTSSAIAAIDPPLTEALQEAGAEHLRIWDISPEIPGALELIAQLSSEGYVTSLAHTRCTIDQASRAVDAGLSLVTHLFDTFEVPSMTDPGVYPAGLVDYLLVEDRVVAEIIPDGTHVPPLLVEKALRCKSPQGLAFVTDSNVGAGLPPGEYKLKWGDGTITLSDENSGARTADGVLAGSALTPLGAFRNAVTLFGRDLATACRLCCETPARLLGLNKGVLEPGRDADVIVLDENLELLYTIVAGEIAYSGV
jgi:N-acetylglucosamine-6-phosphate deacetylase